MPKPKLPMNELNTDKCLGLAREMILKHSQEIHDIIEERETRQGTIRLTVNVDASEATPSFEVTLSVPRKPVKDSSGLEGEQEGQETLPLVDTGLKVTGKVKGAPKKAKDEPATEEEPKTEGDGF